MCFAKKSISLFLFLILLICCSTSVNAALIANGSNLNGGIGFVGLGTVAPNMTDSVRVTYGANNCSFGSGTTTCVLSGDYTEDATSTRMPGSTGTFILTQSFDGTLSPIIRTADFVGSNDFNALSIDPGIAFDVFLELDADDGFAGTFSFNMGEFGQGFNIAGFLAGSAICTGLPMGTPCAELSDIGSNVDSTLTTNLFSYGFLVTDEAVANAVPVPAAVWLFGSSLIALLGFRKI